MKLELEETKDYLSLTLVPENVAEANKLLRFCNNAKKQAPDIYYSFSGEQAHGIITMNKRRPSLQINSINPFGK